MTEAVKPGNMVDAVPRNTEAKRFIKVFFSRPLVIIGFVISLIFIIMAIFAPLLAPHDPNELNLDKILQEPSVNHLLGTDASGRDLLSRVIYGSRISIMVGILSSMLAALIGMPLGLIAGYFGGWRQSVIMRVTDALMAVPPILIALVIAALLGGGLTNVMIAIGVGMVPSHCRLMCGQVMAVKENDYVLSAKVGGASNFRIIVRHLIHNCLPPLIILITIEIGGAILAEAGLSFLGIGIDTRTPSWGGMVNAGSRYLLSNPLVSLAPGFAVMMIVFSVNMVGDGLRDSLDPRLRGII